MTTRQSHIQQVPVLPVPLQRVRVALDQAARQAIRGIAWLIYNLIPLGVIAGFFWLQVQIDGRVTEHFVSKLLIIMSVLFELGVIVVWSLLRDPECCS
jgi:hypothetical protein